MSKPVIRTGRPVITQPKPAAKPEPKKGPPAGLPKPRVQPKQEDPDIAAAKAAVENFEVQKRVLREMKEDWEQNFQEAHIARQDILRQEDIVVEAINGAKPLVAKIKQSIGDFIATRKYSKACYDEKEVTKILSTLENRLDVFNEMLDSGIVEVIGFSREATIAWFAQRPGYSEVFQAAFQDAAEMTCAVTVPKV
jgi:hypothetical protein